MVLMIAHRGNMNGPNPRNENKPSYIQQALDLGYDVEVDVWLVDGYPFLGHDDPKWPVDDAFLKKERLWCHAKNREALEFLVATGTNCFWHEDDKYTLTSKGVIWAYPGQPAGPLGVQVMPERTRDGPDENAWGICSDYVILEKIKQVCRNA